MLLNSIQKITPIVCALVLASCTSTGTKTTEKPTKPIKASPNSFLVQCNNKIVDLETILSPIVSNLAEQKIPYAQTPSNEWRDCSGNFLRLCSYVAKNCPDQSKNLPAMAGISDYRAGINNQAPGVPKARSTREMAKWYQTQGNFTPIFYSASSNTSELTKDLQKYRNHIRVGTVLWFAKTRPTAAEGIGVLNAKINHMGTVASVTRENGNVIQFSMYHGRSNGKVATVTKEHYWIWPEKYLADNKHYPPLGYWSQYLVGFANLLPEK